MEEPDQYFARSRVTGYFGDATQRATRAVRARWDLGVDGEVGPATFGRAGDNPEYRSGSSGRGGTLGLKYAGKRYTIWFQRNEDGKYLFRDRNGDWRQAGYNYDSCG
ncbi:peptidoglycan-binding domain-containing protein [Streptomyces sp. NPDC004980]